MSDIVFHIAVGVKNDGIAQDAGHDTLAEILQTKIEDTVLDVPWVTDMLVSKDVSEDDLIVAVRSIVKSAIKYGVNDKVAETIAHAEVVGGLRAGRKFES